MHPYTFSANFSRKETNIYYRACYGTRHCVRNFYICTRKTLNNLKKFDWIKLLFRNHLVFSVEAVYFLWSDSEKYIIHFCLSFFLGYQEAHILMQCSIVENYFSKFLAYLPLFLLYMVYDLCYFWTDLLHVWFYFKLPQIPFRKC